MIFRAAPTQQRIDGVQQNAILFRVLSALLACGLVALMIGFGFRQDWATPLWVWDDARMSYIFLASIAAAVAAPAFWVAISGEFAAWAGVAIDGTVSGILITAYLLARWVRDLEPDPVPTLLVVVVLTVAASMAFRLTHGLPVRDMRRMPRFVRIWFVAFAAILVAAGSALLFQVDRVFPWNLTPAASTIFGCLFLGAACYFLYSLWLDLWVVAAGALWSFLAYDIVLALPYLGMIGEDDGSGSTYGGLYGSTPGEDGVNELSLAIYLVVIGVSAIVSIFALFIHPATRVSRRIWSD